MATMGFGTSPKQTASPIFRPQRVRENYFPLHEAPRNDRPYLVGNLKGGGGVGSFLEIVHI